MCDDERAGRYKRITRGQVVANKPILRTYPGVFIAIGTAKGTGRDANVARKRHMGERGYIVRSEQSEVQRREWQGNDKEKVK